MSSEATLGDVRSVGGGAGARIRSGSCRRPVLADTVVDRPAHLAPLLAAESGALVVITAPAGYGKTITAAQWDLSDPRVFAWVTLDSLDDDPAHLVAHIATSLSEQGLLDTEDLRFLCSPGRPPLRELVPALLEMLDRADPFVLVLDDVHRLGDAAVPALAALVDGQPGASVVALLGRSSPTIGRARRRMAGTVVELGPADLALDLDDARRVFSRLGVALPDRRLVEVVERCEGWAGGVHLTALALRERVDAASTPVSGRNRLLADYLVEEVLAGLDTDTATFLEEASILEPMSAPLLDAVLERRDSARLLADIEDSGNLFLVPLDDERVWYRFHHLFSELLTDRLHRRDPERLIELHHRASVWFESDGDVDQAVHHALATGDHPRAAALIQRDAIALTFAGRASLLARRLGPLDVDEWFETPEGAMAVAWQATSVPDEPLIHAAVAAARATGDGRPLADGSPSVDVAAALVTAMIGKDGHDGILRNTQAVLDAGPPLDNRWWGMAMAIRGSALFQLGRHDEARATFLASIPELHNLPGFEAASSIYLALYDLRDGDVGAARARADAARVIADRHELSALVPLLVIYAGDALVCARSGSAERARESAAFADDTLTRLGTTSPRTGVFGHLLLAQAHHALQDWVEARRHAAEADRLLRWYDLPDELQRMNASVQELLSAGPAGSQLAVTPLTAAERRVLPLLATHLSLPQIADQLTVSRNTVKTHCVAVYRKLGVSSRAGAVAEARRLGLIP